MIFLGIMGRMGRMERMGGGMPYWGVAIPRGAAQRAAGPHPTSLPGVRELCITPQERCNEKKVNDHANWPSKGSMSIMVYLIYCQKEIST